MADLGFDGNIKASFVPATANVSGPTTAELTAGTSLEGRLTPDGLKITPSTTAIDNSKLASTFTTQEAGRRQYDISVTYVRQAGASDTVRDTLVYQAAGFLVVRRDKSSATAFAAADVVEVYPVECGEPIPATPAPNALQTVEVPMFMTADADTAATVAA